MKFIWSVILVISGCCLLNAKLVYAQESINVKNFGAKGDGKTDDYKALLSAADFLSKKGTGTLFFPKGTYYINVYRTKADQQKNIQFKNCRGLTIKGDQAVISVNGSFYRAMDYVRNKFKYSKTSAIIPFLFQDCTNIVIDGIEVNGNADKMTREPGVVESSGHLLSFNSCKGVTMTNTYLHHAQTDGIYITGVKSADFLFKNVTSSNNGRQGMSIIILTNGRFENCKFINTGRTGGAYGGHAPSAGVDIEPSGKNPLTVSDIYFQNCLFENNKGGQFLCTSPVNTSNVTLDNCTINAAEGTYKYQMILAGRNILLKSCKIDAGKGDIYPVWNKFPGSSVTIKQCTIRSSSSGIVSVSRSAKDNILISENQIIYTGKAAKYFPHLQTANLTFTNNTVSIPSNALNAQSFSLVQKALISSGNVFKTDNPGVKLKVSYNNTKSVKDN